MSKSLGLALIGCGMAAKPHALALKELSGRVQVRGVYARNAERRAAFCAEHGFAEAGDLDALAADPAVDAALIITPPNARQDIVRRFADAGKHILTEKPIERTAAAAEAIVETCEAAGVHLGVVFQHRFRKASQALAARLQQGDLGRVHVVGASVPWWRAQSYYDEPGRGSYARDGGGVLISQAIHTLDLMLSLVGPVAEVQGLTATTAFHEMEAEDFAAAGLRFASGAVGHMVASTANYPGGSEWIRLDCANGSARLQSGVVTIDWQAGGREVIGEEATTGGGADPMAFPSDWHRDLIADFADAVQSGRPPLVTGRQALLVHHLITAIEKSSAERRAISLT